MTSRLHFELFMQKLRLRASEAAPKQLALNGMRAEGNEDVGSVRLFPDRGRHEGDACRSS